MEKFINRLNDMFSHVREEFPLFTTVYEYDGKKGEITYEQSSIVGKIKPIRQNVLIMVSANMTEIIDMINSQTPLSEGDYENIRREIMDHSMNMVKNYQYDNQTL